jgi:tetratricopeptide (TPR) repeat protein
MTLGLILFSKEKKEIILSAISLVFCGTGIFMTLSRGGWVALSAALFSFIVALIISRKKIDIFNYKAITCSLILLFIIFILGPFKYRLFSITKPSDMTFYQRTLINKGIMGAVSKIPITGHGLHTFSQIYPFYRIVGGDYPLYAHNEYLQSMVETGFLSSVFLAFITLGILIISYKSAKQRKYDSIVFAAVFISFVIQNISGFSSRIFPTSILIALSVGALLASQLKIKELKNDYTRQLQYKCINYSLISLVLIVLLGGLYIYIPQYKIYKANQLLFVGKVKEASNIYEKILTYQPSNSIAANSLGFIYQINKQNEKAANTWLKAFEYNKFEAIFPINLARLYLKTNSEYSDLYYKKALELDPASENYRLEYANFLISHNKAKQAKEILQKGLTYSPGFHNVYKGFQEMEDLLKTL